MNILVIIVQAVAAAIIAAVDQKGNKNKRTKKQ